MGDSVLERNVTFVECTSGPQLEDTIHYIDSQLHTTLNLSLATQGELASLLGGRGGSQVDVILYMITEGKCLGDIVRSHPDPV